MKPSTAIILCAIFSAIFWLWYDAVFAPKAELEKALADAAAGNVAQKIRAADMYMICYDSYRMSARVLKRENWSQLRTYGFLAKCTSGTVQAGAKLLEEAAMTGDPEAAYRMALVASTSRARDNSSFEWMKKAAEKGHKLAQISLGFRYLNMKPPNYNEALFWYEVSNDHSSEAWSKNSYDSARNGVLDIDKPAIMKRVEEWRQSHPESKN
jgi:TPR repeat protein